MQRARPELSESQIVLLSLLLAYYSHNFSLLSFFFIVSAVMLCDILNLNEKLLLLVSQDAPLPVMALSLVHLVFFQFIEAW